MLANADEQGFVDLKALDRTTPDWDKGFPSRKWVIQTSTRIRTSGRFAHEQGKKGATGGQSNGSGAVRLSAKQAVLLQVYKSYRDADGRIDWVKAMAEHPEWLREFRTIDAAKQNFYQFKASGKLNRALNGFVTNPAAAPSAAPTPEFTDEQLHKIEKLMRKRFMQGLELVLHEAGFCSKCGNNIAQQVRMASAKLTTLQAEE